MTSAVYSRHEVQTQLTLRIHDFKYLASKRAVLVPLYNGVRYIAVYINDATDAKAHNAARKLYESKAPFRYEQPETFIVDEFSNYRGTFQQLTVPMVFSADDKVNLVNIAMWVNYVREEVYRPVPAPARACSWPQSSAEVLEKHAVSLMVTNRSLQGRFVGNLFCLSMGLPVDRTITRQGHDTAAWNAGPLTAVLEINQANIIMLYRMVVSRSAWHLYMMKAINLLNRADLKPRLVMNLQELLHASVDQAIEHSAFVANLMRCAKVSFSGGPLPGDDLRVPPRLIYEEVTVRDVPSLPMRSEWANGAWRITSYTCFAGSYQQARGQALSGKTYAQPMAPVLSLWDAMEKRQQPAAQSA